MQKLHLRDNVANAWRSSFTSLELNDANPPVWMRITPRELDYGGYTIEGHTLERFPPDVSRTGIPIPAPRSRPIALACSPARRSCAVSTRRDHTALISRSARPTVTRVTARIDAGRATDGAIRNSKLEMFC